MLENYKQTELECWIEDLYVNHAILSPSDLHIENIANQLSIEIVYMDGPNRAIWDNDQSVIFLNPYQSHLQLREVFFHELCHPQRHYGNQMDMPVGTFRELQELQAKQFQLYAAIPYFMVRELELPNSNAGILYTFQSTFNVSRKFAELRLNQFFRRSYQSELEQHRNKNNSRIYNIYHNDPDRIKWKQNAHSLATIAIKRKRAKEANRNDNTKGLF